MAVKTFATGEVLTASDTNTYLNNGGLVYVTSTTIGTAVSSVTVSNCFSSTYDTYRIVVANVGASASASIGFRIGTVSTGIYYGTWNYALYTASSQTVAGINAATQFVFILTDSGGPGTFSSFDIVNPYTTSYKMLFGSYYGRGYGGTFQGTCNSGTSQTGFTLVAETGTLTGGTVTVYGYRKA